MKPKFVKSGGGGSKPRGNMAPPASDTKIRSRYPTGRGGEALKMGPATAVPGNTMQARFGSIPYQGNMPNGAECVNPNHQRGKAPGGLG